MGVFISCRLFGLISSVISWQNIYCVCVIMKIMGIPIGEESLSMSE